MNYVLLFITAMLFVFLRAFQQKNVAGLYYKMAVVTSYLLAVTEVTMVITVVGLGWSSIVVVGTGGAIGVVLAMKYHSTLIGLMEALAIKLEANNRFKKKGFQDER